MRWKPNVTVAAIAEDNGRFLLVEEAVDGQIVYNQPAGHLEKEESLIEAIKREVLEETAWEFTPAGLIGVYLYPSLNNDITYLRFCFHGRCHNEHKDKKLDDGIIQAIWLSKDEIQAQAEKLRSPMVMRCIEDYLLGKSYPLTLIKHALS